MNSDASSLLVNPRKTLLICIIVFSAIGFLFVLSISNYCACLGSLLCSNYNFSAIISSPLFKDDYYRFNASISFKKTTDAATCLNAEVLMQSSLSYYTSAVAWNSKQLWEKEVAITKGLAKANGIQLGDVLFSKNIVDGKLNGYVVKQILPELNSSRASDRSNNSDGIVIFGYDDSYEKRIKHEILVFSELTIEELSEEVQDNPVKIIYREDDIWVVVKNIVPFFVLYVLLSILGIICFVFSIEKSIKANFQRRIIIGFGKNKLDRGYYKLIYNICCPAICISFLVAFASSFFFVFSLIEIMLLFAISVIELITLFLSVRISIRKLWRC